jgi:4'-phosphopantetheinyl transferase
MPLFYVHTQPPDCELAIWHITEPETWFLEHLRLGATEQAQLAAIKGHKRLEWLAVRYLLSRMLGEVSGAMVKDEHGKPHLLHLPLHISISHSHNMAAAIVSNRLVGIDIQKQVAKIDRIAHRVLRQEELESLSDTQRLAHLHVYWGAKESLYKAYGRRELDFGQHILIEPFAFNLKIGACEGRILKADYEQRFHLQYQQLGDFTLVYALEHV